MHSLLLVVGAAECARHTAHVYAIEINSRRRRLVSCLCLAVNWSELCM